MKKITFLLVFVGIAMMSFAQMDLRFGLQVTGNWNWLLNQQVNADGHCLDPRGNTFGEYFGPNVSFHLLDLLGVELGLNFGVMNMKYKGDIPMWTFSEEESDVINHYESSIKYKYIDMPLMFSVGRKVYFEAGMVFHFRTKATYNRSFDKEDAQYLGGKYNGAGFFCNSIENLDIADTFEKKGFGLAVGIGGNIPVTDFLLINLGFRANYILTDMRGVNGLLYAKEMYRPDSRDYSNFKTNPMYFGLRVGVIYKLKL
jgi:hypothetical protein